jgi:hypothetical protein
MKDLAQLLVVASILTIAILTPHTARGQVGVDSLGNFFVVDGSGDGASAVGLDDTDTRVAGAARWTEVGGLAVIRSPITDGHVSPSGYSQNGRYAVGIEDDDWGNSSNECDPRQGDSGWTLEGRIFSWMWTSAGGTARLNPSDDFCYILQDVANTGVAVGFRRDTTGAVGNERNEVAVKWDGASFVDLYPTQSEPSEAVAISGDGSTIVGWASSVGAAVRFEPTGPVPLGPFNVTDVSDDGSVVVGRSGGFQEVIRWNNGSLDTLRASSGFLNGTVLVSGDGKTIAAQWWGPFGPHNGPHTRVFLEDGTNKSLWQLAQDRGVDVGPWVFSSPKALSEDGSIVFGWDSVVGSGFRVELGSSITITYPTANEILVPGSEVDVTWHAVEADTVDVLIAYDYDGVTGTFKILERQYVFNTSPKAGQQQQASYPWTVPDTWSPRAAFRIVKSSKPEIEDTSDLFSIKGYHLTRIDTNGEFEKFDPQKHAWQFANDNNNLAPPDAYNDEAPLLYQNDPITGSSYPIHFTGSPTFADPKNYPDWQSWVRAFTFRWSYVQEPGSAPNYRRATLDFWSKKRMDTFGGACFGMVVTALMAFDMPLAFQAKFPQFGAVSEIKNLASAFAIPDAVRHVIAEMFAYQDGATQKRWSLQSVTKDARQTLADLKAMLLSSGQNEGTSANLTLTAKTSAGFHSVLPYELVPFDQKRGEYFVKIYDPNRAGAADRFITLDSTANTWVYDSGYRGGPFGMWLDDPISEYSLFTASPPMEVRTQNKTRLNETIEVALGAAEQVAIVAELGEAITYRDSTVAGEIDGAAVLHRRTGYPSAPASYVLPATSSYRLTASGWPGGVASASAELSDQVLNFTRGGALPEQSDQFYIGAGLRAINLEDNQRRFAFSGTRWTDSGEQYFAMSDLYLDATDSLDVAFAVGDAVRLSNGSLPQAYSLVLQSVEGKNVYDFESYAVPMASGATHLITPDWMVLSDTLMVLVDNDGDGIYEDSLAVVNSTVGVGREGERVIPEGYRLSQNYPNPFNPVTTISYALPRAADVTLTVVDLLGRVVRELASGTKPAGTYEVSFDATGLPSGVYFYRLEAGDYVETKSLVLLR